MYGASGWSPYIDLNGNTGDKGETGVFDPSTVLSSLTTSDKTVPGAINELNSGKAKTDLSNATLSKYLSDNGYYKAPDGLLFQWGKVSYSTTPQRISELENLFEVNRDNAKIRQMNKDVEDYERAVQEKATLDEQAKLRQQEAERLNHKAEKLKRK